MCAHTHTSTHTHTHIHLHTHKSIDPHNNYPPTHTHQHTMAQPVNINNKTWKYHTSCIIIIISEPQLFFFIIMHTSFNFIDIYNMHIAVFWVFFFHLQKILLMEIFIFQFPQLSHCGHKPDRCSFIAIYMWSEYIVSYFISKAFTYTFLAGKISYCSYP